MTRSDLFLGYLGSGITVCDKSREEYGDYKRIAHIRESGIIKWYIDRSTLPAEVLGIIISHADRKHREFLSCFQSMPLIEQYAYLLNRSTLSDFLTATTLPTLQHKISYLFARQLDRDAE